MNKGRRNLHPFKIALEARKKLLSLQGISTRVAKIAELYAINRKRMISKNDAQYSPKDGITYEARDKCHGGITRKNSSQNQGKTITNNANAINL